MALVVLAQWHRDSIQQEMLKRYLAFPGQSLLALEYGVGLARTWPSGGVPDLATWCPEFLQPFSQILLKKHPENLIFKPRAGAVEW